MLLTPRMAYQREYLGQGMFSCGPSGAIFRTETFRRLGGFTDAGVPSDVLFWMRACATEHVLLLPADLFWYRTHPQQELQSAAAQQQYARVAGWMWQALSSPDCPLIAEEREQARRNFVYHLAKRTIQDLRRGQWTFATNRLRHSTLTAGDWLRYLRLQRRDNLAGTPRGPDGSFVMPAWADARHEIRER